MDNNTDFSDKFMRMNRLVGLVFLAVFTTSVAAQVKVGVQVCPQFNESIGLRIGTDVDIPFSHRWSFMPGAYWSLRNRNTHRDKKTEKGNVIKNTTYDYNDKADFLTIPLRIAFRITGDTQKDYAMKIDFGPYIANGVDGTSKCTKDADGVKSYKQTGAFDADGRYRSRWDYGLNIGLNAVIKQHYQIGGFVETGFRKIYKADTVYDDIMGDLFFVSKINVAMGLSFGYQF